MVGIYVIKFDVGVVGGAGHVGLPLAIMLADSGLSTIIYDIDEAALGLIAEGRLPFLEPGAQEILTRVTAASILHVSSNPSVLSSCESVIVVIGTPVDEHLNPDPSDVPRVVQSLSPHLVNGQLLTLRSTVFPGVTREVGRVLEESGLELDVAFCPERIAEHNAVEELRTLPQIVSGLSVRAELRAAELFGRLSPLIVSATPEEAELAKLFTNTWRYIKFAAANQFYMMASEHGVDFERVRSVVRQDYPRASDMPSAGFAAGPCLLKDTMQLAAFSDNTFGLGHSAMLINEGLPLFMAKKLEQNYDLKNMTVGILGMAFKAESDDIRSSLSYKLKKVLEFRSKRVLTTDSYVNGQTDSRLLPLDLVLEHSDLLVIATPHPGYKSLGTTKPVLDVWGVSADVNSFR
jgi:UDP-N-acetyl-D-mannosaminuronic acid dehydrogenase